MAQIVIDLSEQELSLARERAAKCGIPVVEEYLRIVVAESLLDDAEDEQTDYGAPEHLCVKSREQLKRLIEEGLASPARVYTKEDFAQMRRELIETGRISKAVHCSI